jgi:anti-sigma B factor antagonist
MRPMSSNPLTIEHLPAPGHGVLRLHGPLTSENLSPFLNAIRGENAPTMILDLTECPYIDSAGLGSLISAYTSRQKLGQRVVLAGVNRRVLKVFKITKVEPLFLIFPNVWDALEALTGAAEA